VVGSSEAAGGWLAKCIVEAGLHVHNGTLHMCMLYMHTWACCECVHAGAPVYVHSMCYKQCRHKQGPFHPHSNQ